MDDIDISDVFESIRTIRDPEYHEKTLGELAVVRQDLIKIENSGNDRTAKCSITFVPTQESCSMASIIGLSLYHRLAQDYASTHCFSVSIEPGTHKEWESINRQLADKERRISAMENDYIMRIVARSTRYIY